MDSSLLGAQEFINLPRDLDVPVWRYIDFPKLIAMLDAQALHFARASDLGDPFEGSVTVVNLQERERIAAAYGALLRQNGLDWTDEMALAMLTDIRARMPTQVMVNCWHVGGGESAAMWGLYCPAGQGVAIRSTARKLIEALPDRFGDSAISVSAVRYVDYGLERVPDGAHATGFVERETNVDRYDLAEDGATSP